MDERMNERAVAGEIVDDLSSRSEGVSWTRLRNRGAQVATVVYAGYKWFEDHADEVERVSIKAIERSKGKKIGRAVIPTAHVVIGAARWMQERDKDKTLPKGKRH